MPSIWLKKKTILFYFISRGYLISDCRGKTLNSSEKVYGSGLQDSAIWHSNPGISHLKLNRVSRVFLGFFPLPLIHIAIRFPLPLLPTLILCFICRLCPVSYCIFSPRYQKQTKKHLHLWLSHVREKLILPLPTLTPRRRPLPPYPMWTRLLRWLWPRPYNDSRQEAKCPQFPS